MVLGAEEGVTGEKSMYTSRVPRLGCSTTDAYKAQLARKLANLFDRGRSTSQIGQS